MLSTSISTALPTVAFGSGPDDRPGPKEFLRWKAVMAQASAEDLPRLLRMGPRSMKAVHVSGESVSDAAAHAILTRRREPGARATSQARFARGLFVHLAMICGSGAASVAEVLQISQSAVYEILPDIRAGLEASSHLDDADDDPDLEAAYLAAVPPARFKFGGGPDHDLGPSYVTIYPEAILRAKLLYGHRLSWTAIYLLISMALHAKKDQPFFAWINDTRQREIMARAGLTRTVFRRCWRELFDAGFLVHSPRRKAILVAWRGPEFLYWAQRGMINANTFLPVPAFGKATLDAVRVQNYVPIVFPRRVKCYTEPLYRHYTPRARPGEYGSPGEREDVRVSESGRAALTNEPLLRLTEVRGPPSPRRLVIEGAVTGAGAGAGAGAVTHSVGVT